MKNREIRRHFDELTALEQYCDSHDIRNSGINKIIIYNLKRLTSANDVIKRSTSKELIDLEGKMFDNAKADYFNLPPEEQKVTAPFVFALSKASVEDRQFRESLIGDFETLLEEENEVNLFILEDLSKIDQVDLSPRYQRIVDNFVKKEE